MVQSGTLFGDEDRCRYSCRMKALGKGEPSEQLLSSERGRVCVSGFAHARKVALLLSYT